MPIVAISLSSDHSLANKHAVDCLCSKLQLTVSHTIHINSQVFHIVLGT